jgi:hypothetical protein
MTATHHERGQVNGRVGQGIWRRAAGALNNGHRRISDKTTIQSPDLTCAEDKQARNQLLCRGYHGFDISHGILHTRFFTGGVPIVGKSTGIG